MVLENAAQAMQETYVRNIRHEVEEGIKRIRKEVDGEIQLWVKRRGNALIEELEEELTSLQIKRGKLKSQKDKLEKDIEAKLMNIPEIVSLDDLGKKYERLTQGKRANTFLERYVLFFETDRGVIAFKPSHIQVARIPSSGLVAWVRVGKANSTEDAELIKAWLRTAEQEKRRLGYKLVYSRKRIVDYGEAIERKYIKGDLYFVTYFRFARVQGTYARYSFEYTYYIEWGSTERRKQYYLESYNLKLGS